MKYIKINWDLSSFTKSSYARLGSLKHIPSPSQISSGDIQTISKEQTQNITNTEHPITTPRIALASNPTNPSFNTNRNLISVNQSNVSTLNNIPHQNQNNTPLPPLCTFPEFDTGPFASRKVVTNSDTDQDLTESNNQLQLTHEHDHPPQPFNELHDAPVFDQEMGDDSLISVHNRDWTWSTIKSPIGGPVCNIFDALPPTLVEL